VTLTPRVWNPPRRAGGGDTIGAAYRYFLGVLAQGPDGGPESGQPDSELSSGWPRPVETVLKDLLSLVEITAQQGDNVYRIFESINNTGVGLSQSDLLRNYVFMLLPQQGERVYQELWLPMQQELGPDNLELLVWLDMVVRGHNRVKQSDIYRAQQDRLHPLAGDEDALRREIALLAERGGRLRRILQPGREEHAGLRAVLERLNAWGGQVHYPLALHLLEEADAGQATPDEVAEALGYVESYLVRRMICQVATTNLNRIMMDAPRELERDRQPAEAVRRFLSGRRRKWPRNEELREAIRTKPFYWGGRSTQRAFVLRRLEESYASPEPVDFTNAALTVEHVMPQRPSQPWLDMLAEEAEADEQTPAELHDLLVHTLGNLTLSGENAKLSNHPFPRKQEILDHSALRMNREIADAERWGKAEILARADRIVQRAIDLWPGPIGAAQLAGEEWPGWADLRAALVAMPSGTWTTYGDIAELIGSHPVPVGRFLGNKPGVLGAHRVLTSDGRISPSFRWPDGGSPDGTPRLTPREMLEREGVTFDEMGRAPPPPGSPPLSWPLFSAGMCRRTARRRPCPRCRTRRPRRRPGASRPNCGSTSPRRPRACSAS
jgi:alkylated DNA nucleotide flippase Atl1